MTSSPFSSVSVVVMYTSAFFRTFIGSIFTNFCYSYDPSLKVQSSNIRLIIWVLSFMLITLLNSSCDDSPVYISDISMMPTLSHSSISSQCTTVLKNPGTSSCYCSSSSRVSSAIVKYSRRSSSSSASSGSVGMM